MNGLFIRANSDPFRALKGHEDWARLNLLQIYGAGCNFKNPSCSFTHLIRAQSCEGTKGLSVLKTKPLWKVKLKSDKARTQTWIFCLPGLNAFQYIQILKNIVTGSSIVQCSHETHQEEEEMAKREEVGERKASEFSK